MLSPVCAALALALAATPARPTAGARAAARSSAAKPHARPSAAAKPHARPPAATKPHARPGPPTLAQAEAALRELQRDPAKRRYRHQWEKAIRRLEQAARGKDRAPALLAAARARYALYRFSQVEADRTLALRLAERARRAGAKDAAAFAAAVRREAGDHPPARVAAATPRTSTPTTTSTPPPTSPPTSTPTPTPTASPTRPAPRWTPNPAATATPTPSDPAAGSGPAPLAARTDAAAGRPDVPPEPPSTDPILDRIVAQLAAAEPAPDAGGPAPAAADDPALRKILEQLRSRPPPEGPEGDTRGPVRRVVVDAGHGGHDTGAIGPSGVREKDVTLAMARRLAERLRAAGFEVVLTRTDDRYLALDERTAIANRARGDLFVSLHANAHPRRDQAGVETYVLDVAHDRYAKRLAARENGALDDDGEPSSDAPEVRRILADLDAKSAAVPSRRLANSVQRELTGAIRARFGEVRDLGVKSALFYVLLGARMPAVLVETSFISNRAEERRLASPRFQDEVAGGVARAVKAFADHEARVAAR